jgi:hypothetical protein
VAVGITIGVAVAGTSVVAARLAVWVVPEQADRGKANKISQAIETRIIFILSLGKLLINN